MSGTFHMTVGNKGRVVLPADVRSRFGWDEGTVLIAFETESGFEIMDRAEALRRVRAEFAGKGKELLEELFAERRAEAARDDEDFG